MAREPRETRYELRPTRAFNRRLEIFVRRHPELRGRLARIFRELEEDPFRANLRLHSLTGEQAGKQAVSVTHKYRMLLTINKSERAIELIDIGSHDDVYR